MASCLPACLPCLSTLVLLDFRPIPDLPLATRGAVGVRVSQGRCRGVLERAFPIVPLQCEELLARILHAAFHSVSRLRRGLLSGKKPIKSLM